MSKHIIKMKYRTCPSCGYKYSRKDYYKKLFHKYHESQWRCPECNAPLAFDFGRRIFIIIIGVLPIGLADVFLSYLIDDLHLNNWLSFGILFVITILWNLFLYSFDNFVVLKNKKLIK